MMEMTRLLALDVGSARIGVAVSDATRLLASPYTTLHVSHDETQVWDALQRLIEETDAVGLVIGLPISLDGQIHAQGERILAFVERLKQHISTPITFWDERLSTVEAERLLRERGGGQGQRQRLQGRQRGQRRSQKKRRNEQEIDALAAAVILQEYLDNQRSTTGEYI
ncbi:MAG TPA: Holliday junction resolvase RuvX [Ktedonobacteraceae bacterium]|nr:Holliday junction resolvase RuvX [Ktedonobacteraceae bacterium]